VAGKFGSLGRGSGGPLERPAPDGAGRGFGSYWTLAPTTASQPPVTAVLFAFTSSSVGK
jgi:hypothetical protein